MSDKIEKLKELKELLEQGLIEQAEYDALKKDVIGVVPKKSVAERVETIKKTPTISYNEYKIVRSAIEKSTKPEIKKEALPKKQVSPKPIQEKQPEKIKKEPLPTKVIKPIKGVKPLPPSINVPKGQEKIKLVPKGSSGQPRVVLVPKVRGNAQQSKNSGDNGVESPPLGKNKIANPLLILIGLVVITGVSVLTYFLNQSPSEVDVVNPVAAVDRYILPGNLHLCDGPGEDANHLVQLVFGTKININNAEEVQIGDRTYLKINYKGQTGWVTTKIKGVELIGELSLLNEVQALVKGSNPEVVLEKIPAYAKYALLELRKRGDYGNFSIVVDDNDYFPEVGVFRSKTSNRNSSSDRRKGINDGYKDLACVIQLENNSQSILVLEFDRNYDWSVLYYNQENGNDILGVQRVKRRSTIQLESYYDDYEEEYLEHDAILVGRSNYQNFYLYNKNGRLRKFDAY